MPSSQILKHMNWTSYFLQIWLDVDLVVQKSTKKKNSFLKRKHLRIFVILEIFVSGCEQVELLKLSISPQPKLSCEFLLWLQALKFKILNELFLGVRSAYYTPPMKQKRKKTPHITIVLVRHGLENRQFHTMLNKKVIFILMSWLWSEVRGFENFSDEPIKH